MGGWGVFFLLILVAFLIYFFGGIVMLKLRGAEGLEMIPNYAFWINLPGKIKERVVYCLNGCKKPEDTYEAI